MRRNDLLLILLLALGFPCVALAADPGAESKALFDAEWERRLRVFNDEVPATGSVPLAALKAHVDAWIAKRQGVPR